jgi:hypothetical protein
MYKHPFDALPEQRRLLLPNLELPARSIVVVLAPHPDDFDAIAISMRHLHQQGHAANPVRLPRHVLDRALATGSTAAAFEPAFCGETIRRVLHRLGYVWKRPRYVLAADAQGEKKAPHPARAWLSAKAQCRAGGG